MLSLAEVNGPYQVGVTTFACKPSPTVIGNAKVRNSDGELVNLLQLDEVAFTAYYPADTSQPTRKGVPWLYRPVKESLSGFVKISGIARWILWPIVQIYGRMVSIPVYRNAPLLPPKNDEKEPSEWPLVVFSHGLSGSSTAYSTVCSRLASSGRVVLALEHHDGTAVAFHTDSRKQFYVKEKEVTVADGEKLRTDQLTFRRHEIYLAFQYFKQLVEKDWSVEPENSRELYVKDGAKLDWASFAGTNSINFSSNVTAAGHSFGGATILSLLSMCAPGNYPRIPVSHALLHDPWMDPLPTPGPAPFSDSPAKRNIGLPVDDAAPSQGSSTTNVASLSDSKTAIASPPRLLIINSETFTLWAEHYKRLTAVLENWETASKPLTIVRSVHMNFSDFKLLPLVRNKNNNKIMDIVCDLSIGFLDNRLDSVLKSRSTIPLETRPVPKAREGSSSRQIIGEVGQIAIL